MNSMDRYFEGYSVPDDLKHIVTAICTRFAISGECDPMYIANTIASLNGFGDGRGHFKRGGIINPAKTAERVQWAYGCNILPGENGELEKIISTGTIDKAKAMSGLKAFRQRTLQEMKTCDPWRVDYLKYLCGIIDRSVNAIMELQYIEED
jgi:hypothetical protein